MKDLSKYSLETQVVKAGVESAEDFISTVPPVHHSVTYQYKLMDDLDKVFEGTKKGYIYGRYGNPTINALEQAIAMLELGEDAIAFASGMAAIHATLLAVGARNNSAVVAAQDVYGATYNLLDELMRSQGVNTHFVNTSDLESVETVCRELKPVALFVEIISNPLLKVADIPALSDIAHRHGVVLIVDNTFATPYLIQPLSIGADVVIHSTTKYLSGHGDVLGGIAVASKKIRDSLFEVQKAIGANPSPEDSWLVLRGIRTLCLRMHQQCQNALTIAKWLNKHPMVSKVNYPGLNTHSEHVLVNKLFNKKEYGGMISFDIKGADQKKVFSFFESMNICQAATSLGDVFTLVLYPAHSSHRALTPEERARIGIGNGLVRISVGIEAVEDIIGDLEQAFNTISSV